MYMFKKVAKEDSGKFDWVSYGKNSLGLGW